MKPVLTKLAVLSAIVFTLQTALSLLFPPPLPAEIRAMKRALDSGADILFFGDSVVMTNGYLPEMLEKKLPGTSVEMVEHPANSPRVYQEYCTNLSRRKEKPRTVIIPVSMRYFSPDWEWDPGKQFIEERVRFRYMGTPVDPFMPFLLSFGAFRLYPRTKEEFYRMEYSYRGTPLGTIGSYHTAEFETYSDANMKKKIRLSYVNGIGGNDPVLAAIVRTADRCRFANVLYYITPLSFETGERFLGSGFTRQVNENIRTVARVLHGRNARLVDLSHLLPESAFSWDLGLYMGDHLTPEGLDAVAESLRSALSRKI